MGFIRPFFPPCSDVQCLLEYSLDTFKNVSWQTERVIILKFSPKYVVIAGIKKSKQSVVLNHFARSLC